MELNKKKLIWLLPAGVAVVGGYAIWKIASRKFQIAAAVSDGVPKFRVFSGVDPEHPFAKLNSKRVDKHPEKKPFFQSIVSHYWDTAHYIRGYLGIPELIILGQICQESSGNPAEVGADKEYGLLQIWYIHFITQTGDPQWVKNLKKKRRQYTADYFNRTVTTNLLSNPASWVRTWGNAVRWQANIYVDVMQEKLETLKTMNKINPADFKVDLEHWIAMYNREALQNATHKETAMSYSNGVFTFATSIDWVIRGLV